MTDQVTDQLAKLQAQLAAIQQVQQQAQPGAWASVAAGTPTVNVAIPNGVAIPISIPTGAGTLRVYLSFPGSHAATPQALISLVESLASAGFPLDIWQGNSWGSSNWSNSRTWRKWR